jgi:hypothetical protein
MSITSQVSTVVATALAEGDESDDTNVLSMASIAVQAEKPAAVSSAVAMIRDVVGGIEAPPTSSASAESSASDRFAKYNPMADSFPFARENRKI